MVSRFRFCRRYVSNEDIALIKLKKTIAADIGITSKFYATNIFYGIITIIVSGINLIQPVLVPKIFDVMVAATGKKRLFELFYPRSYPLNLLCECFILGGI